MLPRPAEDGGDTQHQLLGGKGLHHVVVHPQLKPPDAVILLPAGRKHQHRGAAVLLAQAAQGGKAVQLRHHHVQDDKVKAALAADFQGLQAVGGLGDLVALVVGVFFDELADVFLVIHH